MSASRPPSAIDLSLILGATLGLSLKGVFAKLAYAQGVSVIGVLGARILLGTTLFWVLALAMRSWQHAPSRLSWRQWVRPMALGGLFCISTACDFVAIDRLGASLSRVIIFTYPLWVVLLDHLSRRTWPSWRLFPLFSAAWTGLALASGAAQGTLDPLGVSLSLLGAIVYALYTFGSARVVRTMAPFPFTVISQTGTALFMTLLVVSLGSPADLGGTDEGWAWVAAIVLFSTVMPFLLWNEGLKRVGAAVASVWAMTGPLMTLAFAAWLLGERLSAVQWLGALLTMGSVYGIRRVAEGQPVFRGALPSRDKPAAPER